MGIAVSCPSKTFFLGEYLALMGGPAIVLNTLPRFSLHYIFNRLPTNPICRGINPNSPAGKFFRDQNNWFYKYGFEFRDPHLGRGGFGASSAQFLLFYTLKSYFENKHQLQLNDIDVDSILNCYIGYAWDKVGSAPSGADLISQLNGDISFFHKEKNILQSFQWDFPNLEFLIIRTGYKIPTHQHLKSLERFPFDKLQQAVFLAKSAFENHSVADLIAAVNSFSQELQTLNFIAEPTQQLLHKIKQELPIYAAKGCGALGADVVVVICEKNALEEINLWLSQNSLQVIAKSSDLTHGVSINK